MESSIAVAHLHVFAGLRELGWDCEHFGPQIPVDDRWAIVAYVRALELSQMAQGQPSQPEPKK